MEDQCSPLSWPYNYFLEEGIEELKHSLVYTTLELENTVISAHGELARKDEEILQLKDLLNRVVKERDEAQCKWLRLQFQFQKQSEPISSATTISHDNQEHDNIGGVVCNSSDCDENNVVVSPPLLLVQDLMEKVVVKKPLPEKGKFLQAVMEAGPLLQTLLLAGPLPQWQHPPPQLNSIDIPPVTINSPTLRLTTGKCFGKKRDVDDTTSPHSISKYQKVVHHSSLINI